MSEYEFFEPVDDYAEPDSYPDVDDANLDAGADLSPEGGVTDLSVDEGPVLPEPDVTAPPAELRFGALIGPYGETADSWDEKYNYSTTTDSYIGAQSGREIDPWTGTEKK